MFSFIEVSGFLNNEVSLTILQPMDRKNLLAALILRKISLYSSFIAAVHPFIYTIKQSLCFNNNNCVSLVELHISPSSVS